MKVKVYLTITGDKETVLIGEADVFGSVDYTKSRDTALREIGFWLKDWRYAKGKSLNWKCRVFIPWGSTSYIVEMKEK